MERQKGGGWGYPFGPFDYSRSMRGALRYCRPGHDMLLVAFFTGGELKFLVVTGLFVVQQR
jgi:hypothetical protein